MLSMPNSISSFCFHKVSETVVSPSMLVYENFTRSLQTVCLLCEITTIVNSTEYDCLYSKEYACFCEIPLWNYCIMDSTLATNISADCFYKISLKLQLSSLVCFYKISLKLQLSSLVCLLYFNTRYFSSTGCFYKVSGIAADMLSNACLFLFNTRNFSFDWTQKKTIKLMCENIRAQNLWSHTELTAFWCQCSSYLLCKASVFAYERHYCQRVCLCVCVVCVCVCVCVRVYSRDSSSTSTSLLFSGKVSQLASYNM